MILEKLRFQLALWYGGLSLIVCVVLTIIAAVIFFSAFNFTIFENLRAQTREIRPAIQFTNGNPSLRGWALNAKARQIEMMYTVQLYDQNGNLLEEYGPPGIPHLGNGLLSDTMDGKLLMVHSRSRPLTRDGKLSGYLQIEESTIYRDEAIKQLLLTISIVAPLLIVSLGFCAYILAGKALRPTEEAIAILRRFIADAGHELNTPITIIQAALETIQKRGFANDAQDLLKSVGNATERLKDLGAKLIILAKAESPNAESPMQIVDISQVIESVVCEYQSSFHQKGITLFYKKNCSLEVLTHVDSFVTVLNNLLENALQYTEPGGSVDIELSKQGSHFQVAVSDTGMGIPQTSIPRIYERFYRVDKSRSRKVGGTGLGLSIVKAIIDSQKGSINLESTVGKGSRFIVTLPSNQGSLFT